MNLVTDFATAGTTQITGATNSIGAFVVAPLLEEDKRGGGGGSQSGRHPFQEVALWLPGCSPEFLSGTLASLCL